VHPTTTGERTKEKKKRTKKNKRSRAEKEEEGEEEYSIETRKDKDKDKAVEKKCKDSDAEDSDGWTKEELTKLNQAQQKVQPQDTQFWEQVSRSLPGRTAAECADKFNSLFPTPDKSKVPKQKPEKEYSPLALDKKGTIKQKRKLRNLSKQDSMGHVDDAFGATPLRRKQKVFQCEISGDERDIEEIFTNSQQSDKLDSSSPSSSSSGKTTGPDTILKPFNVDVLDGYVNKLRKIVSVSSLSRPKKKSPKATLVKRSSSSSDVTTAARGGDFANAENDADAIASLAMLSAASASQRGEDSSFNESAEDYYYSDASDEI